MTEPQDKDELTEEIIRLQKKLSEGTLTAGEKKRLEELKMQLKGGGKQEQVKFKVKSPSGAGEAAPRPEAKGGQEIKEAKVIEVPERYERRSSYSIDDIKKKIDRLDSEGVGNLRDRYKEKYGEELYVPDLHSDNVREALEDVKPYLDVDTVEAASDEGGRDTKADKEKEGKGDEEKDEGPGFFSRLIASIKAFFARIFSRKGKKEETASSVDDAAVVAAAASNGD